eukprot:TRINITY_DN2538_c0_g1_i1.p1 TRINITY_DN2538_c0_g1~~TRINITY_DN2538_c0_g1_i1.p1  ORF type:complete len:150 (+),score=20.50 TRINITY_DN2538_c0_g1_i1:87-536(+)
MVHMLIEKRDNKVTALFTQDCQWPCQSHPTTDPSSQKMLLKRTPKQTHYPLSLLSLAHFHCFLMFPLVICLWNTLPPAAHHHKQTLFQPSELSWMDGPSAGEGSTTTLGLTHFENPAVSTHLLTRHLLRTLCSALNPALRHAQRVSVFP